MLDLVDPESAQHVGAEASLRRMLLAMLRPRLMEAVCLSPRSHLLVPNGHCLIWLRDPNGTFASERCRGNASAQAGPNDTSYLQAPAVLQVRARVAVTEEMKLGGEPRRALETLPFSWTQLEPLLEKRASLAVLRHGLFDHEVLVRHTRPTCFLHPPSSILTPHLLTVNNLVSTGMY